mgnify:CR=1 FL=1
MAPSFDEVIYAPFNVPAGINVTVPLPAIAISRLCAEKLPPVTPVIVWGANLNSAVMATFELFLTEMVFFPLLDAVQAPLELFHLWPSLSHVGEFGVYLKSRLPHATATE